MSIPEQIEINTTALKPKVKNACACFVNPEEAVGKYLFSEALDLLAGGKNDSARLVYDAAQNIWTLNTDVTDDNHVIIHTVWMPINNCPICGRPLRFRYE